MVLYLIKCSVFYKQCNVGNMTNFRARTSGYTAGVTFNKMLPNIKNIIYKNWHILSVNKK